MTEYSVAKICYIGWLKKKKKKVFFCKNVFFEITQALDSFFTYDPLSMNKANLGKFLKRNFGLAAKRLKNLWMKRGYKLMCVFFFQMSYVLLEELVVTTPCIVETNIFSEEIFRPKVDCDICRSVGLLPLAPSTLGSSFSYFPFPLPLHT